MIFWFSWNLTTCKYVQNCNPDIINTKWQGRATFAVVLIIMVNVAQGWCALASVHMHPYNLPFFWLVLLSLVYWALGFSRCSSFPSWFTSRWWFCYADIFPAHLQWPIGVSSVDPRELLGQAYWLTCDDGRFSKLTSRLPHVLQYPVLRQIGGGSSGTTGSWLGSLWCRRCCWSWSWSSGRIGWFCKNQAACAAHSWSLFSFFLLEGAGRKFI